MAFGKRAGEMPGNKVLQAVGHAVAFPWAEAERTRQGKPRAAAEARIVAAFPHEAPDFLHACRSQRFRLAPRGTSGHHEHLARQTGLGYV